MLEQVYGLPSASVAGLAGAERDRPNIAGSGGFLLVAPPCDGVQACHCLGA